MNTDPTHCRYGTGESAGVTCDLKQEMERDFKEVFKESKTLPPVKQLVQHHIETEGRPAAAKY